MKVRPRILVCALFAVAVLAGTASARTIHVSAAYTGSFSDGSETHPFRSISTALYQASAGTSWETGDVVLVHPGRYSGYFRPRNYVTIQGTDPAKVILYDPMMLAPSDAPFVRFSKLTVYDDCHTAFTINRIGLAPGTWYFDECAFQEIRRAVDLRGAASLVMTRCVFYGGDYDYSVMQDAGTGRVFLSHCVFHAPAECAVRIVRSPAGGIDIVNSIFSNAWTAISTVTYAWPSNIDLGHLVSVRYSDLHNSNLPATVFREGMIAADPMFRRPVISFYDPADFSLKPFSPCVDMGLPVGMPYLGAAPDMGAYESDGVVMTLLESVEALAQSYSELTAADLESPAEQRRNALLNKMDAVDRRYDEVKRGILRPVSLRREYQDLRDKLTGDLIPKCDGHLGGNPDNDWIVDPGERAAVHDLLATTVALLDREIAALP